MGSVNYFWPSYILINIDPCDGSSSIRHQAIASIDIDL